MTRVFTEKKREKILANLERTKNSLIEKMSRK